MLLQFRLVLRAKSTRAKEFHEWAERMDQQARKKPSKAGAGKSLLAGGQGGAGAGAGGSDGGSSRKILIDRLPKVDAIWEDFATRNLIVDMAVRIDRAYKQS